MNKLLALTLPELTKAYCLLTKPRIILGNVITTTAGFALGSQEHFKAPLFLAALLGLSLIIASACIFNNYIDKEADQKMARTRNRALATGAIKPKSALFAAFALGALGSACLGLWVNYLSLTLSLLGFFVYVSLYSLSKYHTVYGTLIGSIAGALPPVIGYVAVQNQLDFCALILFAMLVLWQMPHFFAIALYRLEDYSAASIPVLPLKKGIPKTKIQMTVYIAAFLITASLLTLFGYTGIPYLVTTLILSTAWGLLSLKGFKCVSNHRWARKMFLFSLIVITGISLSILFNTL